MYHLEEEAEGDWWEVEALYDLCFAPGRAALSSYRLRDGVAFRPVDATVAPCIGDEIIEQRRIETLGRAF